MRDTRSRWNLALSGGLHLALIPHTQRWRWMVSPRSFVRIIVPCLLAFSCLRDARGTHLADIPSLSSILRHAPLLWQDMHTDYRADLPARRCCLCLI